MMFLTISCANYLPQAAFLANSVKKTHPSSTVVVCLLERSIPPQFNAPPSIDYLILARDLPIADFEQFVFRHGLTEAATAIKAKLFLHLLDSFQSETDFVYLDPDIWVFSRLTELETALNKGPMVLTPHHLADEATEEGVRDNMFRTLKCGIFNLGFLAIRRSDQALSFLQWWAGKLERFCYVDFAMGLFVDQKWIDLALSFFDFVILREPGYNVANWNVSQRRVVVAENGQYLVNDVELRFFHFSGISQGRDKRYFTKYGGGEASAASELRERYRREVDLLDGGDLRLHEWSYDFFDSGERISMETRYACRRAPELLRRYPQPFTESNETFLRHWV